VLHIHRAERADGLADALAALCAQPLEDPFAVEVIAVPTRGMERWLTQRMSSVLGASQGRADGICAGVRFPFLTALVADAVASASGIDPLRDPWLPERATWPLLEIVEQCIGEPWLESLAAYLGRGGGRRDPVRETRRLSVVRHLAWLFDRYALHRPEMVGSWAAGLDSDSVGAPLAAGAVWQAELWRRLRARIGVPGPAQRRARACERLAQDGSLVQLPDRFSLFGLTRLPAGQLQVLRALAQQRDAHLFLLHPSAALWDKVADREGGAPAALGHPTADGGHASPAGPIRRADDPTAGLAANRLLASWGRDSREIQLVLASAGTDANTPDTHHGALSAPATLLGRIQDDIRRDRAAPGAPLPSQRDRRPLLAREDRSIEIHSCHGRARQVEVVRDAILHALAEDENLEPRDVIVMCPDIETFAPLIQATFGAGEPVYADDGEEGAGDRPHPIDLRVRLADRSLRQTNPVLGVVSELLELAQQRLTASQVLDLADRAPVRRRFHFDDDDLTRLQDWISQAGIRWGLDASRRSRFKLESVRGGTWETGLERLLLGVTMTEDGQRLFADVLPLDDVDSRSIDLAGRFAELIARLTEAIDALGASKPLADWAGAIGAAADALTATAPRDGWQRAELQRVLDEIVSEIERDAAGARSELAPAEMRAYLFERLQGRPTRANFRTGHLTVCTLMPMRSVPHQVVCLLGLDDAAFPRKAPRDGDDLILDTPQIGERDPRSEDRQLLLDALLAATGRLVITYSGNDERTNTPRPAAVPVGELLETIDATMRCEHGPARMQVLVRHPLQPFDPRNFEAQALMRGRTWSFDPVTLQGAQALIAPRATPRPFLRDPLPPRAGHVIELADLVRFVEHPVRAFLRQRLGISLRDGVDEIEDGLPVELDPLERWAVGQRLLEALRAGVDGNTAIRAEIARGMLPPELLGKPAIDAVYPMARAIAQQADELVAGGRGGDPLDVRIALDDGRLLNGTVSGITGDILLATTYSRVAPRHRLAAWVRLLAVAATHPERELSAATIGRAGRGDDVRVAVVPALADHPHGRQTIAVAQLATLIDLYDRGMREPLPIFCATSAAYAAAAASGLDPVEAAEQEFKSGWRFEREDAELEHQLVLGGVVTFAELLAESPRSDEAGDGWAETDTYRVGRLARRLWDGLLAREEVGAR
jgi:exodeoxyribonuclease V gamma subunit